MKNTLLTYSLLGVLLLYIFYKIIPKSKEHTPKDEALSSLTDIQASSIADVLHVAMNQYGTDEDSIFNAINGFTSESDYNKIYNAFGVRSYDPDFGFNAFHSLGEEHNLSQWLHSELSSSEVESIKNQFGLTNL